MTDPYVAASDGSMVITIAQKLKDGSGVVAMDITIDKLLEQMKQIKVGKEGYVSLQRKTKPMSPIRTIRLEKSCQETGSPKCMPITAVNSNILWVTKIKR